MDFSDNASLLVDGWVAFSAFRCSLLGASPHCRQLLLFSSVSSVFVSFFCIRERVLYA